MTGERLERAPADEALRIIEEAKSIDAADDERYGTARGDELPAELADRTERLRRLRKPRPVSMRNPNRPKHPSVGGGGISRCG